MQSKLASDHDLTSRPILFAVCASCFWGVKSEYLCAKASAAVEQASPSVSLPNVRARV